MSSAPGPVARLPSSRQPSKWPGGNTVSWWPTSTTGAPAAPRVRQIEVIAEAGGRRDRRCTSAPGSANASRSMRADAVHALDVLR